MNQLYYVIALALLAIQPIWGQGPVILLSGTGKIQYKSPEASRPVTVVPGALMNLDGQIIIRGKGSATLQYDKDIRHHDSRTLTRFRDIFNKDGGLHAVSSINAFPGYVEHAFQWAFQQTGDTQNPWGAMHQQKNLGDGWGIAGGRDVKQDTVSTLRSGDGWGIAGGRDVKQDTVSTPRSGDGWGIAGGRDVKQDTVSTPRSGDGWGIAGGRDVKQDTVSTPRSGDGWGIAGGRDVKQDTVSTPRSGDGWGIADHEIRALKPYGYLTYGSVEFRWQGPNSRELYIVEVLDKDGRAIAKGSTNNSSLQLNLDPDHLDEGQRYTWRVRTPGTHSLQSNELILEVRSEMEKEAYRERAINMRDYADAPGDVQALMRAMVYEQAQWFDDAIREYERAVQLQGKKGQAARLMYAAFLNRQGNTNSTSSAFSRK